jgi:crossover junction endodeoxyribonuclease RuvC
MRIFGLDPGLATTGFAALEITDQELKVLTFGCIRTSARMPLPERLRQIQEDFASLLKEYHPDSVAVEKIFFAKNVKTAGAVWQSRGALLAEAVRLGLPVFEYSPNEIKVAVTSDGHADKLQVQTMLKIILNLKAIPTPDDAADALATALCCHYHGKSW